jgi:hypothetical protein
MCWTQLCANKCCDVRYDFRIKTIFGPSLSPAVCRRAHVLFTLYLLVHSCFQSILCCVFVLFVFVFCFVYPVLPVSLDCPFWLSFRYSLTFIYSCYLPSYYPSWLTKILFSILSYVIYILCKICNRHIFT